MKTIEWINPNKMKIDTGHKTFDRQCRAIFTGNQIGDCVDSSYVRPKCEVKNGSFDFPIGQLQAYDLSFWKHCPTGLVSAMAQYADQHHGIIVYEFFHYRGDKKIIHGWIVTTKDHRHVDTWVTGSRKGYQILSAVLPYITREP